MNAGSGTARDPLIGAVLDRWLIVARLGRGGMGDVYRAVDSGSSRTVAIKIVSAARAADPAFLARFDREARAASALEHRNVARVEATGLFGRRPYYVMEYVEGRTLARVLDEEGPLAPERALGYVRQACDGLAAAHASGIVHRDVKPENLMVDADGRLKVVDFGLARPMAAGSTITQADRVMGTPQYMAPEQATTGTADQRSDIYALGATFYHLVSGAPPFSGETAVDVMLKHVNEPPVPLEARVPGLTPRLASAVGKMLSKTPADRFQDYAALAAALEAAARDIEERGTSPAAPREEPEARRRPAPGLPLWVLVAVGAFVAAAAAMTTCSGRRGTFTSTARSRAFDGAVAPL